MIPKWVLRDKEKYLKRVAYEKEMLENSHPQFKMLQEDDGTLYIRGQILSKSNNIYDVKIIYPDNYPYSPPVCLILDRDVKEFCKNKPVPCSLHNYGVHLDGLKLCILKEDDSIGTPWRKDFTIVTMIPLVAIWLNLYEFAKEKGEWIGPEAD